MCLVVEGSAAVTVMVGNGGLRMIRSVISETASGCDGVTTSRGGGSSKKQPSE